ncbi:MAG TPA: 16S rRNA (uracil(1498)-N(3))-methyltransferase [Candidatus Dormibacteraeota bacterium]|nr:16S rRNA (uracil(1498)-N(3))-methyltransferase [Candidatus Dormibacteraeota bacterium]
MPKPRRPDTIFWVDPDAIRGDRLTLDREESHHLLHVHRAVPGTAFVAVDGAGGTYECRLESSDRGVAVGAIDRQLSGQGELSVPITLLVGLPDAGPTEAVVAHAVPLGAFAIDFVACDRAGRPALGSSRLGRLSRVAVSALKQSRRSCLPAIRSSASMEAAIALLGDGPRYVADPESPSRIKSASGELQGFISLAVGPPGGFTEEEGGRLLEAGFRPISLGNSRLTTETAAIAFLAVVRNQLE